MNGIIIGLAALYEMEGVCLLGETSGYLIDAGAARAILEALSRLLGIKIELSMLTEKAEETRQVIGQIQRMVEQQGEPTQDRKPGTRPDYIG
jgi:proteasome assembly chaperone (PAC2) family protein